MAIKLNDIKDPKLRAKIFTADAEQNRVVLGGMAAVKQERNPVQPLDGGSTLKRASTGGVVVVVVLVACRNREIDDDANVYSFVPLRDAISKSLGLDDADKRIRFKYGQVVTNGEEGVIVKIELLEVT